VWRKSFNLMPQDSLVDQIANSKTDSSMYSFMVGQGVPEKLLISPQVYPPIGRSAYSSCSCVYRAVVFFGLMALFIKYKINMFF
jgi:hypothetical protein